MATKCQYGTRMLQKKYFLDQIKNYKKHNANFRLKFYLNKIMLWDKLLTLSCLNKILTIVSFFKSLNIYLLIKLNISPERLQNLHFIS